MKFSANIVVSILIGLLLTLALVYSLGIGDKSKSGPPVIVASAAIDAGAVINASNSKVVYWSGSETPPESFKTVKELEGRVAKQNIYSGEPILNAKLAPVGSKVGMESLIAVGKRAITVRVNDVVGVAGFALPGSYVDIIANLRDNHGQSYSKVVLKRIKVLAVAQETEVDTSKAKVVNAVTLELTPEESEQLDLARSIGTLSLALRNELDKSDVSSKGVNVNDLLKEQISRSPVTQNDDQAENNQSNDTDKDKKAVTKPVSAPKPVASPKPKVPAVEEIRGLNRNKQEKEVN